MIHQETKHGPTFVPAVEPGSYSVAQQQRPIRVEPMAPTDIAPAMKPTTSGSRDSLSAQDRAKGFNQRMIIPMALVVILGLAGAAFWALSLSLLNVGPVAPWMLDRVLVFVAVVGGMGFYVWTKANQTDYDHTHAGTERHRVTTAAEVRIAEIAAHKEVQIQALDASLRLLEERKK